MKIDAKIEWVIDDKELNIKAGTSEIVEVDSDYVEADEQDIAVWISGELEEKYNVSMNYGFENDDEDYNCDFVIKNMDEILDGLKMEEFNDKTELTIDGSEM